MTDALPDALTALYVPASRPELFGKALNSIADRVVLDLEDAVAAAEKDEARANAVSWLRDIGSSKRVVVRMNAVSSEWGRADLDALAALNSSPTVRIPKAERIQDVEEVVAHLGADGRVECLVESAVGIENVAELARVPGVAAIALGETDLMSDLGASSESALDWVRGRIVVAARAAGLSAPMMSVFPAFQDLDGLRRSTIAGRTAGFVGRNAIHPTQLRPIAEAFRPSGSEVERARSIVHAVGDGGATTSEYGMLDAAMLHGARRVLELERLAARALSGRSAQAGDEGDVPGRGY